jgi:hypothetical protein
VFLTSALVFAAGAVLAAVFFPSKTRLAAMRESLTTTAAAPTTRLETEQLDKVGAPH